MAKENLHDIIEEKKQNKRISNQDIVELLVELLIALDEDSGSKSETRFTDEEIDELKKFIADSKAMGRVWSLFKTALLTIGATILAWNVLFDNTKAVLKSIIENLIGR